ncbi:MAG: alpha/beta hydrolase [Alphaproteobacteria bacterium]|nr:alpha/beta hydrolase [Alphaproteobacteria bacterium]
MDRRMLLGAGMASALLPRTALGQHRDGQIHETGYLPGDSQEFIALWPDVAPGGAGIHLDLKVTDTVQADGFHVRAVSQIQQPGFFVYRPVAPTGLALLVIPGGGYAAEGGDRGGREIAQYFARLGIISFVLRYRLPGEGWKNRDSVPLQDAQRAMRLIRAGEYGAQKLGVIGFSAGGHLSASLALRHGMTVYDKISGADSIDAKPFIAAHMYPVITMGPGAHPGSRDKLLGENPTPEAIANWSLEKHVGADTPPSFIALAADDDVVPPMPNGIAFYEKLREAAVPSQLHVFEAGGHGFSLHWAQGKPCGAWPELFLSWAGTHGFKV